MAKIKPPKIKRKRLTMLGFMSTSGGAFRSPTNAITAKGGLIAKTRKPA